MTSRVSAGNPACLWSRREAFCYERSRDRQRSAHAHRPHPRRVALPCGRMTWPHSSSQEAVARAGVDPADDRGSLSGLRQSGGRGQPQRGAHGAAAGRTAPSRGRRHVNRLCASGLNAVNQAARAIAGGEGDIFVAGGVESMTRAPYSLPKNPTGFGPRATSRLRHDAGLALSQSGHGGALSRWKPWARRRRTSTR